MAQAHERTGESETVLVGSKPPMSYVLAIVTLFRNGTKEVRVRARGNMIPRAIEVAEIARLRFIKNLVADARISSEELESVRGGISRVPAIEIRLAIK